MKYVRLTPYNKQTGALCRRFNVGGCLFKGDQWYQLNDEWAGRIASLRQPSGAPVFEIVSRERYDEVVRAELAAAYARGGVSLALANPLEAPRPASAPKTRSRRGEFDGMDASEVDVGETLSGGDDGDADDKGLAVELADDGDAGDDASDESGDTDVDDAGGEEIDLSKLRSKKSALDLASEYGIALDESLKLSEMREALAKELFE